MPGSRKILWTSLSVLRFAGNSSLSIAKANSFNFTSGHPLLFFWLCQYSLLSEILSLRPRYQSYPLTWAMLVHRNCFSSYSRELSYPEKSDHFLLRRSAHNPLRLWPFNYYDKPWHRWCSYLPLAEMMHWNYWHPWPVTALEGTVSTCSRDPMSRPDAASEKTKPPPPRILGLLPRTTSGFSITMSRMKFWPQTISLWNLMIFAHF